MQKLQKEDSITDIVQKIKTVLWNYSVGRKRGQTGIFKFFSFVSSGYCSKMFFIFSGELRLFLSQNPTIISIVFVSFVLCADNFFDFLRYREEIIKTTEFMKKTINIINIELREEGKKEEIIKKYNYFLGLSPLFKKGTEFGVFYIDQNMDIIDYSSKKMFFLDKKTLYSLTEQDVKWLFVEWERKLFLLKKTRDNHHIVLFSDLRSSRKNTYYEYYIPINFFQYCLENFNVRGALACFLCLMFFLIQQKKMTKNIKRYYEERVDAINFELNDIASKYFDVLEKNKNQSKKIKYFVDCLQKENKDINHENQKSIIITKDYQSGLYVYDMEKDELKEIEKLIFEIFVLFDKTTEKVNFEISKKLKETYVLVCPYHEMYVMFYYIVEFLKENTDFSNTVSIFLTQKNGRIHICFYGTLSPDKNELLSAKIRDFDICDLFFKEKKNNSFELIIVFSKVFMSYKKSMRTKSCGNVINFPKH